MAVSEKLYFSMKLFKNLQKVSLGARLVVHNVIPTPGRLRQEDCKFKASLDYTARPYLKKKKMYLWGK
jgi:hypothetical protein